MKKSLLLVGLACFLLACSQSSPAPTPAAAVQGDYIISRITVTGGSPIDNGQTNFPLILNGERVSGIIRVTPGSTTAQVKMEQIISRSGSADQVTNLSVFDLNKSGTGYELVFATTRFGTIDGTNLTLDILDGRKRTVTEAKK